MRMRTLGGTGIKVSPYCLGAMMFGAWGNPDHDESIRIIHAALDSGINFIDTADVYSAGESEKSSARRCSAAATTWCWPLRRTRPMGEDANMRGNSRRWIVREVENSLQPNCRPTTSTSTRCTVPTRTPTSTRPCPPLSDLVHSGKVRAISWLLHVPRRAHVVEAQWVSRRPEAALPRAVPL